MTETDPPTDAEAAPGAMRIVAASATNGAATMNTARNRLRMFFANNIPSESQYQQYNEIRERVIAEL